MATGMQPSDDKDGGLSPQRTGWSTSKWVRLDKDLVLQSEDLSRLGAGSRCLSYPLVLSPLALNIHQGSGRPIILRPTRPNRVGETIAGLEGPSLTRG